MPKRATIVNAVSGSPGGLNQSSVTTRHAESPEDMSARVREAALSQRKSTSDLKGAKYFRDIMTVMRELIKGGEDKVTNCYNRFLERML